MKLKQTGTGTPENTQRRHYQLNKGKGKPLSRKENYE
jgi:hypothetical protein